ncbi:hypothetical protein [Microbacterium terricola]|uniref:Uncharacterized protein n=1 Tax=Microbacterium terricola TaxID=344163 RepID=A0ABM8DZ18_9MICO|nr:hypothetical protein [Microbacterium terricola]UYK41450.1 hypothetical protein OAU46_07440 [Microbacterium terricola]BDV30760.1 hypothetical protein Microterr_14200 [Microbacterium terricola]
MSTAVLHPARLSSGTTGQLTSADRLLLAVSGRLEQIALDRIDRRAAHGRAAVAVVPATERRRDALAAGHSGIMPR